MWPTDFQIERGVHTHVQFWEISQDLAESVMVVLLGEFHFAHIEMPDAVNLVMPVYYGRCLPLGFR